MPTTGIKAAEENNDQDFSNTDSAGESMALRLELVRVALPGEQRLPHLNDELGDLPR